jgi:hypothetical protein
MSINWVTLKERGNEEYKKKKYSSAITFYTDGISKLNYYLLRIRS